MSNMTTQPADPLVVIPMLLVSLVPLLHWIWTENWKLRTRVATSVVVTITLVFLGARALGMLSP